MRAGYFLFVLAAMVAVAVFVYVASLEGLGLSSVLCWLEVACETYS